MFKKIAFKYTLIRIRMKISFMAYEKRLTILELFLIAIKKSNKSLEDDGLKPFCMELREK